ncbi:MAG: Asp-tRNA(Asn)/Glu-tRNA(Gln) amidotransferase subunit GatC [Patescibacteria group bacterium]
MSKVKIDINHIAKLANLPLSAEEEKTYDKQLTAILEYVKHVESVDTKDVEPTFNVTPNKNITRKDTASKSLTQDEALNNVSNKKNGFVVTGGVFENE